MTRTFQNAHDARCLDQPCERKVHAAGRCQFHYNRDYRRRADNPLNQRHTHDGLIRTGIKGWGSLT